jgi:hypothetical protein
MIFYFFCKFAYLLFVCNRKLLIFFFFFQLDSLLLVCTIWTQSNTNIVKRIYKTLIFVLDVPPYSHITKKALQMFCATSECDSDSK